MGQFLPEHESTCCKLETTGIYRHYHGLHISCCNMEIATSRPCRFQSNEGTDISGEGQLEAVALNLLLPRLCLLNFVVVVVVVASAASAIRRDCSLPFLLRRGSPKADSADHPPEDCV